MTPRGYQHDFSHNMPSMYDAPARARKAKTMVEVLADYHGSHEKLGVLHLLDVGSSTGIIDNYLSRHFAQR